MTATASRGTTTRGGVRIVTNDTKIGDAVKVVTAGDHRLVVDSGLKFVMGWRPVDNI